MPRLASPLVLLFAASPGRRPDRRLRARRRSTTRPRRPTTPSPPSRSGSQAGRRSCRSTTTTATCRRSQGTRRPAVVAGAGLLEDQLPARADHAEDAAGASTSTTTCTSGSASAATCSRCPRPTRTSAPRSTPSTRSRTRQPRFARQTDNCLTCHASTATGRAPGHLVRSVFTDRLGLPILSAGSFRTDHASPFKERWGGWYVTGTHGDQEHMGNWVVREPAATRRAETNAERPERHRPEDRVHGRQLPDARTATSSR